MAKRETDQEFVARVSEQGISIPLGWSFDQDRKDLARLIKIAERAVKTEG